MTNSSHDRQRPSLFDVLTRLVVPSLGLGATLVAQHRGNRLLIWILTITVLVSLVVSFGPWLIDAVLKLALAKHDARVAKRRFPEFRTIVADFGKLLSAEHSIHDVVLAEVFSGHYRDFDQILGIPEKEVFTTWWHSFNRTVNSMPASLSALLAMESEFRSLIDYYASRCIGPVFDLRSVNFNERLVNSPKGKLNLFRERFMHFLDAYEQYLKNLENAFAEPRVRALDIERPQTL
jgi:hypothetical protein